MKCYSLQRLIDVLGGKTESLKDSFLPVQVSGISTDSRSIGTGEVFFAIRGKNYNGADFVDNAFESGAVLSVVNGNEARKIPPVSPVVTVDDTVRALGKVAADYRSLFTGKVVAVTGTNGKTTVKEMMLEVLGTRFAVHGTTGNFNNQIGLPLSIFGLEQKHDCAVFELGMNAPGEIAYLADITRPDIGVILNVGPGHIESFKGLEEIAEAKMELFDSIGSDQIVVINGDDELLKRCEERTSSRIIRFGIVNRCDFRAENIEMNTNGYACFTVEDNTVKLKIPGYHNIYNALAAYTIGRIMGVDGDDAADAIGHFKAPKMRMNSFMRNGVRFIDDTYNANPLSMKAAAEVLKNIQEGRKIAVLGDMLELGDMTEDAHLDIGRQFGSIGLDQLCLVGENADLYCRGAVDGGMRPEAIWKFADRNAAAQFICNIKRTGDVIFVKGSRALGMEKIINGVSEAD